MKIYQEEIMSCAACPACVHTRNGKHICVYFEKARPVSTTLHGVYSPSVGHWTDFPVWCPLEDSDEPPGRFQDGYQTVS